MNKLIKYTLVGLTAVFLAGCSAYTLVKQGEQVDISSRYSVVADTSWNRAKGSNGEIWTVDGNILQMLQFVSDIKEGDVLWQEPGVNTSEYPKYNKGMNPLEIKELYQATLGLYTGVPITTKNLQPEKFGSDDGFKFEFEYADKEGLRKRGFAVIAKLGDNLNMVVYAGTDLYYFQKNLANAQAIVRSIKAKES